MTDFCVTYNTTVLTQFGFTLSFYIIYQKLKIPNPTAPFTIGHVALNYVNCNVNTEKYFRMPKLVIYVVAGVKSCSF